MQKWKQQEQPTEWIDAKVLPVTHNPSFFVCTVADPDPALSAAAAAADEPTPSCPSGRQGYQHHNINPHIVEGMQKNSTSNALGYYDAANHRQLSGDCDSSDSESSGGWQQMQEQ